MLVELKNGETLNGHLVTCDTWMNLTLKEVVQTSPVHIAQTPTVERWNEKLTLISRMETSFSGYLRFM